MREWGYATAEDTNIKGQYKQARAIEIKSNMVRADAEAVADDLFELTKGLAIIYEVPLQTVLTLDDWANGPPCFTTDFKGYAIDDRVHRALEPDPKLS